MNVMKAGYEILTPISEGGKEELQMIERIGRVCYKSEDKITEEGGSNRKNSRSGNICCNRQGQTVSHNNCRYKQRPYKPSFKT